MPNRHPFWNQQLAAASGPEITIVSNRLIQLLFRSLFEPGTRLLGLPFSSFPKSSCYPVCHQRVEDAAVKKRCARR